MRTVDDRNFKLISRSLLHEIDADEFNPKVQAEVRKQLFVSYHLGYNEGQHEILNDVKKMTFVERIIFVFTKSQ